MTEKKRQSHRTSSSGQFVVRENMPTRMIGQKLGRTDAMAHKERLPNPGRGDTIRSRDAITGALVQGSVRVGTISAEEVRKGLPTKAVRDLAQALNVDRTDLIEILGISFRTFQRAEEEGGRLGSSASDRLARIKRILELATHVFGATDKASIWLTSQSRALEGEVPLQMLDTDIGTQRVQQELRQIEFGMPI